MNPLQTNLCAGGKVTRQGRQAEKGREGRWQVWQAGTPTHPPIQIHPSRCMGEGEGKARQKQIHKQVGREGMCVWGRQAYRIQEKGRGTVP